MKREIWYISKYAVHKRFGPPTRQYFFSKYFAKKGRNVTLISSRSSGIKKSRHSKFKNHFTITDNNLKSVLINGPLISLGFNPIRVYSWIVFEIRTLIWAFIFKKKKPDVIIVSSLSILTFLTGSLLKKIYKCNLVCEVRDIWPLTVIEARGLNPNNLFLRFLAFVEKVGYKNADIIVGSMPNLKEHLNNKYPQYSNKVKYIPMGFDPDFFEKENIKTPFPLEKRINEIKINDSFTVGYAGAIGFLNCIDEIIDAAKLLEKESISFLILGDGPLRESFIVKVERENITNVHFLGAVQKDHVQHFLKKCDLLIHPVRDSKIYRFGLSPNKWIDYMYSGRPILVSYNGYQNIINEADCGVFIDANNPEILAQIILDFSRMSKNKLLEMGKRGKKYLEDNLNYEILSNRYLKFIDDL